MPPTHALSSHLPPRARPSRRARQAALLPAALLAAACAEGDPASPPVIPRAAEPLQVRAEAVTVLSRSSATVPLLTSVGGVDVYKSGLGSGMAFVPGASRSVYLLTDRGPNIDGINSTIKVFPVPSYAPRIYRATYDGDRLRLDGEVILRRADGVTPLTGLPIPAGQCGSTLEVAQAVDGSVIPPDEFGLDPEGIVALADGSFWLSDEYGPFIAHYDATGRELQRLSPCNGGLPEVYRLRRPNRGMEGLTITPDGQWLVGIMQAPLENPSSAGVRNISQATRILFRHVTTGATREYLYLLDSPTLQGNSEIVALSDTRFLVIERDGNFLSGSPPAALKRLYVADVSRATDISTLGALGATPIGGTKTLEQATVAELLAAGIVPATKGDAIDLVALGYPHDKPEGLALVPGGGLLVANDDDFGIVGAGGVLQQKWLPGSPGPDYVSVWRLRLR